MENLGNRIKKEREYLNLSREDLAQKIGVSYSAIAMYEQGNREPNNEILLKMCEIFNCSMDYLMGKSKFRTEKENFDNYMINQSKINILKTIYTYHQEYIVPCSLKEKDVDYLVKLLSNITPQNKKEVKEQINLYVNSFDESKRKKVRELINIIIKELIYDLEDKSRFHYFATLADKDNLNEKNVNTISNKFYMCPVYGQISAGQPNWAEECIEGRLPIDPDLMGIVNPEEHFFLRVNGESMNNVVKNGAFALIHKQDMVEDGEIAVVLVNGYDATLKRFTKKGDVVVLEPDSNDPSFKTQIYDKTTPIKILGKYVGKMEINK